MILLWLRCFYKHFLYLLLSKDDIFFCHNSHLANSLLLFLLLLFSNHLFFGKRRIFFHHDLVVLFLLTQNLLSSLFTKIAIYATLYFFIIEPDLFFETTHSLFFSFAFTFLLLAIFFLLTCYDMITFSRSRLNHWSSFWLKLRSWSSRALRRAFSRSFSRGCYLRSSSLAFSWATFFTSP